MNIPLTAFSDTRGICAKVPAQIRSIKLSMRKISILKVSPEVKSPSFVNICRTLDGALTLLSFYNIDSLGNAVKTFVQEK